MSSEQPNNHTAVAKTTSFQRTHTHTHWTIFQKITYQHSSFNYINGRMRRNGTTKPCNIWSVDQKAAKKTIWTLLPCLKRSTERDISDTRPSTISVNPLEPRRGAKWTKRSRIQSAGSVKMSANAFSIILEGDPASYGCESFLSLRHMRRWNSWMPCRGKWSSRSASAWLWLKWFEDGGRPKLSLMPTFRHHGETDLVFIPRQKVDAAVMMGMKVYPGLCFFRCEWAASCEDTSLKKIEGADARYYIYDENLKVRTRAEVITYMSPDP